MTAFAGLQSPVIGFFDTEESEKLFVKLRGGLLANLTATRLLNKAEVMTYCLVGSFSNLFFTAINVQFSGTYEPEWETDCLNGVYQLCASLIHIEVLM